MTVWSIWPWGSNCGAGVECVRVLTWELAASEGVQSMGKKKNVRVDLRKNLAKPARHRGWTRGFQEHGYEEEATTHDERARARGDLSRKRTVVQEEGEKREGDTPGEAAMPAADTSACLPGR